MSDSYGRWPLIWENGVVSRQRLAQTSTLPAEAPRTPQTVSEYTAPAVIAPDAAVTAHLGRWSLGEMVFVWAVATVVVLLFLASPLGAQLMEVAK